MNFSERSDPKAAAVGRALLIAKNQMFEWWHRVRDGTIARSTFQRHMRPLQQRVAGIRQEGVRSPRAKTPRTCLRLLDNVHALWTFVHNEGIEPTNNIGERAIRRAVILRKTSFGSQSEHGCRFIERVLTVHATLRQRRAVVHDYIVAACRAHMLGKPAPSLLAA